MAKNPGVKPNVDYSKNFTEIKNKILNSKDDFEKKLQYINYLHLSNLSGEKPNHKIIKNAFNQIKPSSYLWSIDPSVLDLTLHNLLRLISQKIITHYIDKVIATNKDKGVVSYLLFIKMDYAQSSGKY